MACALLAAGCSEAPAPEGQVLLYLNSDAPLSGPEALFDRLRVEIFPPGEQEPCVGCAREFGVEPETMRAGRASVGIAPPPGERGHRVRVQLYRSAGTAAGEPRPASTIEKVVLLPPIEADGIVELTVTLWTDDVARPQGSLDEPLEPEPGPAQPHLVGSWPGAEARDCPAPPRDDEVCIPGGAFWMGDPRLDLSAAFDLDGALERLVVLSPYYLDRREVSVAGFRESGLAHPLVPGGPSDDPHEAGGNIAHCTYTSQPGPFDDHPVNCISWNRARLYCEKLGKTLPSEAQLERAMTGLGRFPYVWGHEPPQCDYAVHDREGSCQPLGVGPQPAGSGLRDRLAAGRGEAVDLAGNLIEWAADRWNREDEPCWGTGVFVDPRCDAVSPLDGDARTLRGGDWQDGPLGLRAAVRTRLHNETQAVSARLGFRCARPALAAEQE